MTKEGDLRLGPFVTTVTRRQVPVSDRFDAGASRHAAAAAADDAIDRELDLAI